MQVLATAITIKPTSPVFSLYRPLWLGRRDRNFVQVPQQEVTNVKKRRTKKEVCVRERGCVCVRVCVCRKYVQKEIELKNGVEWCEGREAGKGSQPNNWVGRICRVSSEWEEKQ
jgi:hypothetical protein